MSRSLRPLGQITDDMEPLLQEMVYEHELQWGEILNLVYGYLKIHCPDGEEVYEICETSPEFYYGPRRK